MKKMQSIVKSLWSIVDSAFQFVTQRKIGTRKGGCSVNLHLSRNFGTAASRVVNRLPEGRCNQRQGKYGR